MDPSVKSKGVGNGDGKVVLLRRAGSGGCVIGPPDEAWQLAVRLTNQGNGNYESDTDFRIALIPESIGYGKMPGCSIMVLPGDHDCNAFRNNQQIVLNGIPRSDQLFDHPFSYNCFRISTNFEDLRSLHSALGEVIASIEAKMAETKR